MAIDTESALCFPMAGSRVDELIEVLALEPHPEGGYFREVFRSTSLVWPTDERSTRAAVTSIYYLLPSGQVSRWHRVRSDEVWHLYEGGPLEILVAPPDLSSVAPVRLGTAATRTAPVATVPAGCWQAARPLGTFALAGCTVGPGFEYADFRFLRDEPASADALARLPDAYRELL